MTKLRATQLTEFSLAGLCRQYQVGPASMVSTLTTFSSICWAKPQDDVVNQLFGVSIGLRMSIVTFDWSQTAWTGCPNLLWLLPHLRHILYYTNVSMLFAIC